MAPSAKKKGLRRAAASESCLFNDAASNSSSNTGQSMSEWGADGDVLDSDPFEAALDEIQEKRSATREHGLATLVGLLASQYYYDEACERQDSILQLLLSSIRRGGPTEASLAARGLALHAITLGAGDESAQLLREAVSPLVETAKTGKATGARALAADTVALLAYVGAEDFDMTAIVMGSLEQLRSSVAAKVQTAALRGWSLLLTTLPAWQLTAADIDRQLASLADLLESPDVEVRSAAGETVALLFHTYGLAELDAGDPTDSGYTSPRARESESKGATASSPMPAATDAGVAQVSGLDEVVARMKDLASNRGDSLRRSKRDRSTLKGTFRDLVGMVEEGAVPETRIKLRHGDMLVVDSLAGIVQLNVLRRTLQEGFQTHLQENPFLHQVFNYTPKAEPAERLTQFEKRLYRSPNSAAAKQHTQQRKSHRADSAARKGTPVDESEW